MWIVINHILAMQLTPQSQYNSDFRVRLDAIQEKLTEIQGRLNDIAAELEQIRVQLEEIGAKLAELQRRLADESDDDSDDEAVHREYPGPMFKVNLQKDIQDNIKNIESFDL